MSLAGGVRNGLREIRDHKVRSSLTMSGIAFGVAALVATIGIVDGMLSGWEEWLDSWGGMEKVEILPQPPPEEQRDRAHLSPGRTVEDAHLLRQSPRIAAVAPVISHRMPVRSEKQDRRAEVVGVVPDHFEISRFEVVEGRPLTSTDVDQIARVVVIGWDYTKRYFDGPEEALGQSLRIQGVDFEVVGVTKNYNRTEESVGRWSHPKNRMMLIPLPAMSVYLTGDDRLTHLDVKVANVAQLTETVTEVENILFTSHRGIEDFQVRTQEESYNEFNEVKGNFNIGMGGVAAISLLVGGLGILNVMLASISERVREIGVRKAVGASSFDIFGEFVAEAVTLSVVGGFVGVLFSLGFLALMQQVFPPLWAPTLRPDAVVLGFAFSVLVGILAGIYPAVRASRLHPVEALAHD